MGFHLDFLINLVFYSVIIIQFMWLFSTLLEGTFIIHEIPNKKKNSSMFIFPHKGYLCYSTANNYLELAFSMLLNCQKASFYFFLPLVFITHKINEN